MGTLQAQTTPTIGNQLYQLLPRRWRQNDHSPLLCSGETVRLKFHQRFFRVFGDTYDDIRTRYGELLNWFNPYRTPAEVLEYLAANYGWPLDTSIDEDFQRILISNLHLIYSMAGTESGIEDIIFAHTGIQVELIRPNGPYTARAVYRTLLTSESTEEYLEVEDTGIIQVHDIVTVIDGTSAEECVIDSIVGNNLYHDGLEGTFPAKSRVILGPFVPTDMTGLGYATVGGRLLMVSDRALTDLNAVCGSQGMKSISDGAHTLRHTMIFRWPTALSASDFALVNYLIEYMLPARDHYVFIYES